jgi:CheY-like chemotaxis protein
MPVVAVPAAKEAANKAIEAAAGAGRSGRRVLIVDDNRDAADSLCQILRLLGHDARAAYDGAEGLALAGASPPDVMLLDIGMPRIDGYTMARKIRETAWGRHVTLIAVTGFGQEEDRRRAFDAGFDHHIVKPVDVIRLQQLLSERTAPDVVEE